MRSSQKKKGKSSQSLAPWGTAAVPAASCVKRVLSRVGNFPRHSGCESSISPLRSFLARLSSLEARVQRQLENAYPLTAACSAYRRQSLHNPKPTRSSRLAAEVMAAYLPKRSKAKEAPAHAVPDPSKVSRCDSKYLLVAASSFFLCDFDLDLSHVRALVDQLFEQRVGQAHQPQLAHDAVRHLVRFVTLGDDLARVSSDEDRGDNVLGLGRPLSFGRVPLISQVTFKSLRGLALERQTRSPTEKGTDM